MTSPDNARERAQTYAYLYLILDRMYRQANTARGPRAACPSTDERAPTGSLRRIRRTSLRADAVSVSPDGGAVPVGGGVWLTAQQVFALHMNAGRIGGITTL